MNIPLAFVAMRRIRRDGRHRPATRVRATSREIRRRLPTAAPGVVLAAVVAAAIVVPGFGVAVTGGSMPPPPDLGGPILLPAGVPTPTPGPGGVSAEPVPMPTEAVPGAVPDEDARRRLAEMAESRQGTEELARAGALGGVPAVTVRPLPAAVAPEPSAAPEPAAWPEPAVTVPSPPASPTP
ncbi:hypothetical protein [Frankia sp. CcI49]|uniref:hypothetical protein n=1 Tax=Frankia sp. CcI49 TaxID=1745382 RepID=UPI00130441A0|nr:hypothetical protein [Frankia sp. CcI49]